MIDHHVLFRLRRPADAAARERFLTALDGFAADPPHAAGPGTVAADLGLLGDHPRAGDATVTIPFADEAALAAYMADPRHRSFVDTTVAPVCEGWWAVQSRRNQE
ncbi:Dabb family protein [Conexibacter stalactiti]|uniref:Dabb family protein n=1 Tax=Conexibacter stalactiti TaxID=1940611 RepID=A0ABU4HSH4_9ACTN|nr:Dabb family protein [Conexibacter stalactiti]MDW5596246.1 Dabb family protein [Conexibacter stalactiti]MEC5036888.1 Dabb family protein [Conexibacter stalactiti]